MPIVGESRKYESERASKERPARSKSLERARRTQWMLLVAVVVVVVATIVMATLLCATAIQWR